jgi:hypothetical protein
MNGLPGAEIYISLHRYYLSNNNLTAKKSFYAGNFKRARMDRIF